MPGNADGSVVIRVKMTTNDAQKELNHLKKKIIDTQRDISLGISKRNALTQDLERANALLDQMKAKARSSGSLADWAQVEPYEQAVINAQQALDRQNAKLQESQMLLAGLSARYDEVSKKVGFWQRATDSIKNGMRNVVKGISSAASGLAKMLTNSKLVSKQFNGLKMTFRRLVPAMLATEGILGILRKAVSAYMQQNQQLASTLNGVWSGLGNLLSPIIDRMVTMLATAVAYITKFLNLLGFVGKSTSKQIQNAGGAAKKETDKLEKQLLGFDEINKLSDQSADSVQGGGGAAAPIAPEVTMPDWVKIMAEQLKSAQWGEAATTLTTALNDMVNRVDWSGIGNKIGHYLNGALTFLATAVRTFDWVNLGGKLASGVNEILNSVDWKKLGYLFWAKFKIIIETLAGFLANLDMSALATAFSDFAIGFIDGITESIANVDWGPLTLQLIELVSNIDWNGIVDALVRGLGAASVSIGETLFAIIGKAWISVVDWWHEVAYEDGKFTIAGLLNGILDAIKNIGTWISEHIFKPFMDGVKTAFGIHSPSTAMAEIGGYLIDGLLQGLVNTWQKIKSWISDATGSIKSAFLDAWESIRNGTLNIWNGIVDGIKGAVNGVISVINRMISAVVSGINRVFALLSFNISLPGGHSIGLNLPQFTAPQIPYLAKGAVIPPNAPFMAMLGDQRHGTNIEAPLSTIEEAVAKVTASAEQIALLREQNRLLQAILENSGVYLDGKKLADTVSKYQRQRSRALGV